jgi:hypothetical protein
MDHGDVRVIHDRQRLPLRLEAGDDLPCIHARLDDFEGHFAADRLLLLGHEDQPHAAFTDLLHELIGADHRAGPLADRVIDGVVEGGVRLVQKAVGFIMGSQ